MSVKAGMSLPGPFFVTFPVIGPGLGVIAIIVLPMLFVVWISAVLMYWSILATVYFVRFLIRDAAIPATQAAVASHQRQKAALPKKTMTADEALRHIGVEPKMTADEAVAYVRNGSN